MRVAVALALLPGVVANAGGDYSSRHRLARHAGSNDSQIEEGHAGSKNGDKWRRQYVKEYAEAYVPDVRNASDYQSWRDNFVHQYAEPYRHYVNAHERVAERYPHVKSRAEDTHTLKELKDWREAQHLMAKSYIPAEYRAFSNGAVEQEYEENKARIKKEIAAREANETDSSEAPHSRRSRDESWHSGDSSAGGSDAAAPALLAQRADNPPEGSSDGAGGDSDNSGSDGEAPAESGESEQPTKERKHRHKGEHEEQHEQPEQPEQPEADEGSYGEGYGNYSEHKEWRDRFVNKYAAEYKKYIDAADRLSKQYKTTPIRAEDAKNLKELKKWKEAQHSQIEVFIPHEYRHFVAGAVEQDYERNKARLEKESESEPEGESSGEPAGESEGSEDGKGDSEQSSDWKGDDGEGDDSKGDGDKSGDWKGDGGEGGSDKGDGEKSGDWKGDDDKDGSHEGSGKADSPTRFMAVSQSKVPAAGGSAFAALPSTAPLLMATIVGTLLTTSAALLTATVRRGLWRPRAEDMTEQLLRPEAPLATA